MWIWNRHQQREHNTQKSLVEVIGAGLQTSEWTNSRGLEAWKSDVGKGNWCILPLRQCIQWDTIPSLGRGKNTSIEESAVLSTLLLGWPNLWCHKSHLFDLFTWKIEDDWNCGKDEVYDDAVGLTVTEGDLMKFFE